MKKTIKIISLPHIAYSIDELNKLTLASHLQGLCQTSFQYDNVVSISTKRFSLSNYEATTIMEKCFPLTSNEYHFNNRYYFSREDIANEILNNAYGYESEIVIEEE